VSAQTGRPVHPRPAVGVVVIESGRLLLIQRSKSPYREYWAVPGGKVRWGETLAAAAAREAEEETGLIVRIGGVLWVGETMSPSGEAPAIHNVLIDFEATVARQRSSEVSSELGVMPPTRLSSLCLRSATSCSRRPCTNCSTSSILRPPAAHREAGFVACSMAEQGDCMSSEADQQRPARGVPSTLGRPAFLVGFLSYPGDTIRHVVGNHHR